MKKVLLLIALCAVWSMANAERVTLKSAKDGSKNTEFQYYIANYGWKSVIIEPGKSVVVENMDPNEGVMVFTGDVTFTCTFGADKKVKITHNT